MLLRAARAVRALFPTWLPLLSLAEVGCRQSQALALLQCIAATPASSPGSRTSAQPLVALHLAREGTESRSVLQISSVDPSSSRCPFLRRACAGLQYSGRRNTQGSSRYNSSSSSVGVRLAPRDRVFPSSHLSERKTQRQTGKRMEIEAGRVREP